MKESIWAVFIISIGIVSIAFVFFFQTLTNAEEHNYHLLKETTEAAMYDAFDLAYYRKSKVIRIDREKFVENFIRRFAENVTLTRAYDIKIYDVNEQPPKVSIKLSSSEHANVTESMDFSIVSRLDAILEAPYKAIINEDEEETEKTGN